MTKKGGTRMGYDVDDTRATTEWWLFVRDAARLIRAREASATDASGLPDPLVGTALDADQGPV